MDKSMMPVILFCFISITISYLVHRKVQKFILACIFAAIISSVCYQILGYFVLGYLDPFFLIALSNGAVVAFFLALFTGIPLAYKRKKNEKEK